VLATSLKIPPPVSIDAAEVAEKNQKKSFFSAVVKPRSARTKVILVVIALLAAIVFFARNSILGTPVEGHLVISGELRQTVVASGRVIWPQRVDVAAEITGRVSDIPVKEGQQVTQGQLLIQLEDKDERANVVLAMALVAQTEAAVRQQHDVGLPTAQEIANQAEADAEQIRHQLARMRQLKVQNFVSEAELEMAERNVAIADSKLDSAKLQVQANQAGGSETALTLTALAQAKASLQLTQIKLEQDSIRAPATGTLISRSVEQGDMVQAGKVLMIFAAQGDTQLEVQIDEKNLAKLAIGQSALASADAFSEQRFNAEIIYINPGIDASRGSVEIKLQVKNPPAYLRQDMTVSVDIETAKRSNTLVIPAAALRDSTGENPWVLVVRDNHTHHQIVTIGLRGDNNIEVLKGLNAGEAVVLPNLGLIKAEQHVRVTLAKPI
jgi:HlyD family secretion protein